MSELGILLLGLRYILGIILFNFILCWFLRCYYTQKKHNDNFEKAKKQKKFVLILHLLNTPYSIYDVDKGAEEYEWYPEAFFLSLSSLMLVFLILTELFGKFIVNLFY